MPIDLEALKKQLATSEQELENYKAALYRVDSAIQILRHLIADAEKPTVAPIDELDV